MNQSKSPIFSRPASLAELAACLKLHKENPDSSYIVAGCTDFLAKRNGRTWSWDALTDITAIPELKKIELIGPEAGEASGCVAESESKGSFGCTAESVLRIGAACTHAQIAEDFIVNRRFKALALACSQIGSPQVRNRGTIGGNAANASPAADTVPVLMAFGAEAVLMNSLGEYRRLTMDQLILSSGKNALKQDEAIIAFELPAADSGTCDPVSAFELPMPASPIDAEPEVSENCRAAGLLDPVSSKFCRFAETTELISAFVKLGDRTVVTIAKISLTLAAESCDGKLRNVKICVGAAGAKPFFARASEVLEGKKLAEISGCCGSAAPTASSECFSDGELAGTDGVTPNKTILESLAETLSEDIERSIPGRASMPYKKRAVKGLAADLLALI